MTVTQKLFVYKTILTLSYDPFNLPSFPLAILFPSNARQFYILKIVEIL